MRHQRGAVVDQVAQQRGEVRAHRGVVARGVERERPQARQVAIDECPHRRLVVGRERSLARERPANERDLAVDRDRVERGDLLLGHLEAFDRHAAAARGVDDHRVERRMRLAGNRLREQQHHRPRFQPRERCVVRRARAERRADRGDRVRVEMVGEPPRVVVARAGDKPGKVALGQHQFRRQPARLRERVLHRRAEARDPRVGGVQRSVEVRRRRPGALDPVERARGGPRARRQEQHGDGAGGRSRMRRARPRPRATRAAAASEGSVLVRDRSCDRWPWHRVPREGAGDAERRSKRAAVECPRGEGKSCTVGSRGQARRHVGSPVSRRRARAAVPGRGRFFPMKSRLRPVKMRYSRRRWSGVPMTGGPLQRDRHRPLAHDRQEG